MLHRFANPTRFLRFANAVLPWCTWISVALITAGIYFSFAAAPADYQQGQTVRIMYVHVPAAWMAMFTYAFIVIASATGLIWKHPIAHISATAAAPVGACFTLVCLVTGSFWGKPMWGTWWVWDARLTSVLILFFLYLGFIVLHDAFDDTSRGARAASILAVVGAINVPIIKFSVDWWNTLHQPASFVKLDGPAIHSSMLIPLLLMACGYTGFYLWMLIVRVRAELNSSKIRAIRIRQANR